MPLLSTLGSSQKGSIMTINPINIFGIPHTDTLRVLEALDAFINERIVVCEQLAEDFDEVDYFAVDEFERFPFTQSVNWRYCVTDTEDMRRHRGNRIGVRKPKEVK